MTKQEYRITLQEIILGGQGFDAIRDLSEMLANYDANIRASLREMQAEQQAIRKICEGTASNKEKVQTVLTMME